MSKLDELIKRLCPNGVPSKKIGDLTTFERPDKYIVQTTDYNDEYETPVLTAGQTFVLGYTNENQNIFPASKEEPVIIFDDFTGAFKWVDFPFKVKSSAMKILRSKAELLSLRFLFHYLGHLNLSSSEHKRLWIAKYSELEIPLPPLEVQNEIVRILNHLEKTTAELIAELSREFSMRKKQNEFYKNSLLKFDTSDRRISFLPLSNVCSILDAMRKPVSSSAREKGQYPYYGANGIQDYVSGYLFDGKFVLVGEDGSVITPSHSPVVNWATGKIWVNNHAHVLAETDICLLRYLYHYLKTMDISDVVYGNVPKLTQGDLKNLMIAVPPIDEQQKLVDLLDKLDSLSSDLSNRLPAEIAARQKQYEYYRDKLLTFKELV